MGIFEVPQYEKNDGILAGILAILLSGLGILIFGIIKGEKDRIILGIICLVLSLIFVGWIIALIWGIMVLVKSLS